MVVLVNPITKAPTAFEPGDGTPNHIFSGKYQNVAEVTEEWVAAERERLGRHASVSLPATTTVKEWGGNEKPAAQVRCITCGTNYAVGLDYDVESACPFCRSPVLKAVVQK